MRFFFSCKRFSSFFNKSLCWFIFHCILVIWWFVGTSTLAPFGPHWSYLVHYVYFGSIWSNSVFIVSIRSILSTLICFSPIRAIRSNLVLFSPLCPLQSYSIIYIYIYMVEAWGKPHHYLQTLHILVFQINWISLFLNKVVYFV